MNNKHEMTFFSVSPKECETEITYLDGKTIVITFNSHKDKKYSAGTRISIFYDSEFEMNQFLQAIEKSAEMRAKNEKPH